MNILKRLLGIFWSVDEYSLASVGYLFFQVYHNNKLDCGMYICFFLGIFVLKRNDAPFVTVNFCLLVINQYNELEDFFKYFFLV